MSHNQLLPGNKKKKEISNKNHQLQNYTWDRQTDRQKKSFKREQDQHQDQLWLQLLQKIGSNWKLHQIQRDLKAVDDPSLF